MSYEYSIKNIIGVLDTLLGENGCLWDKKQTSETIVKFLLDEVYELIEAVNNKDTDNIKEELGDVLFGILFLVKLAERDKSFSFDDVTNAICKKMVFRHPHVFSDAKVENEEDLLAMWDKLKQEERNQKNL